MSRTTQPVNHRVRAILLTGRGSILLMKRLREGVEPYWVLPGGGVEDYDGTFEAALKREIREELGGVIEVGEEAYCSQVDGEKDLTGWQVQHHYFICKLLGYDISRRHGPEFNDPTKGQYIPEEFRLDATVLAGVNIFSDEIKGFLVTNAERLAGLFT